MATQIESDRTTLTHADRAAASGNSSAMPVLGLSVFDIASRIFAGANYACVGVSS